MENSKEKSFEYAHEAIKLIITLATGVLAFSITFLKDFISDKINMEWALITSWSFLLLTILCGVWCLLSITGSIYSLSNDEAYSDFNIMSNNIKIPSIITITFFVVGMTFYIIFAWGNFESVENSVSKKADNPALSSFSPDSLYSALYSNLFIVNQQNVDRITAKLDSMQRQLDSMQNFKVNNSTNAVNKPKPSSNTSPPPK